MANEGLARGEDPFEGLWKMNVERSTFDVNHRPSEGTMRFERQEDGYIMYAEGISNGRHIQEQPLHFIFDGQSRAVPGADGLVAVATRPDANTIRVIGYKAEQIAGEGVYTVSADGSTLTTTIAGTDAEQRSFQTSVVWDRE